MKQVIFNSKTINMRFFTSILLLFMIMTSCDKRSIPASSDYMGFENVSYINEFPTTITLTDDEEPNVDVIGIKSFMIYDSLLIVSTTDSDGLWSFMSLPNYTHLGNFIRKGNGPYELEQPLRVDDNVKFLTDSSGLFANIYDFYRGKILKFNINETIKNQDLHISTLRDSVPPFMFNFIMLDSMNILCKEVKHDQTEQFRYILTNKDETVPPVLQKLNQASIKKGEDINILSTITRTNDKGNIIIEMPIGLNYINMYSLDGAIEKTICVGNKLDNISKIQEKGPGDRMYTFADLRIFKDFWGVVYINEDTKTYQTERKNHPSIQLFDWKGEPLLKLNLENFITSFDIDLVNGVLYTFDVHSDEFYKYDVKNALTKLKERN